MIQENEYEVNIVKCFFINCTLILIVMAVLFNSMEPYLPDIIRQSISYGKLNFKYDRSPFVRKLEVPKSWFKHFYIFAGFWCILALSLTLKGLLNASSAPDCVIDFLDFFAGGKGRKVLIDSTSGLLALVLVNMQVVRRFYETHFVQIFSSKSKMHLWHYLLSLIHYFGIVLALLANTEGFVRGTTPSPFLFSTISKTQYICCFIFYFGWSQQRNSNKMLANLRKDDTGNKVTEKHFMPHDGFFEYVSSPHLLFEVVMYAAICGIIPACSTWWFITIWIMANQTENAWLTHKWYKENIKDYPKERYAIYPKIL